MRFEFYSSAIADVPKLSVDGTVDNAIHFSHWHGNQTPESVKADTSTETVLNVVAAPNRAELTRSIDLVTNNHFDTDGVLSVWTMLNGERALPLREKLIAAAEAGDFSEFSSVDGVRTSIVIQGGDSPIDKSGSPLAQQLAGKPIPDEAEEYLLVLPHIEYVIKHTDEYENLWRKPWQRIETALDSFAKGESTVEESASGELSVVTLSPAIFGPRGFDPSEHAAPFTAISHHAHGQLFLITTQVNGSWAYRIDYPYYSWAETIIRPRIPRRDFTKLVSELNSAEQNASGRWEIDVSELSSAIKYRDRNGLLAASQLSPDVVAGYVRTALTESRAAEANHA
ncbi:MAG TPA: DUF6687 family protein [Pyrinomonadaceae bacterium]|jgi:uncharacterized protein DUF6687|nr:DUF6687 family protein [Pyrinomonadaceae bacterium]